MELRRDVGYVPQDLVLFYGSVRENIALGAPGVDDVAVLRAAEQAGVTDFVNRHPRGFTRAEETLQSLSGLLILQDDDPPLAH